MPIWALWVPHLGSPRVSDAVFRASARSYDGTAIEHSDLLLRAGLAERLFGSLSIFLAL